MGTDGEEGGVELAGLHGQGNIVDLGVQSQHDAEFEDASDFGIEHFTRQPVFWYAEAHHAAGQRTGFMNFHRMTQPRQMIGGGQARRPGAIR